jgi:Glycogen debranching enzyme
MKKTITSALLLLPLISSSTASHAQPPTSSVNDRRIATTNKATIEEPYEIKAAVPNHPRLVLKNGKHFLVMDEMGLMPGETSFGYGLYSDDTRFLTEWDMKINGENLALLSASTEDGYAGSFVYGNKAVTVTGQELPEQSVLVRRDIVITDAVYERLQLTNYGANPAKVHLTLQASSDFADMFEVRGSKRKLRGTLAQPSVTLATPGVPAALRFSYEGLDKTKRTTVITAKSTAATQVDSRGISLDVVLPHLKSESLELCLATDVGEHVGATGSPQSGKDQSEGDFEIQRAAADKAYKQWRSKGVSVTTDNETFNNILERGFRDLYILRQPTPRGMCVAAGIPWFAVAFGRDQIITGLETLPFLPELSKEVLFTLAAYQGSKVDSFTEEQPGKIMHELRLGEMALMREIPFIPYYGTVDATPLWVVLLGRYFEQTNDLDTVKELWEPTSKALEFLEGSTTDGYLYYGGKDGAALSNQGWKDSGDSVMYSDATLAKPPIALCEVQGYLYDAWLYGAQLAEVTGHHEQTAHYLQLASELKTRFNKDFWMSKPAPDGYVAIALDGAGKQCDVVSSNPGHLLISGILDDERKQIVGRKLIDPAMFSGWGIRTLSAAEQAYNPMSYHNGSVWPHDNSFSVAGLYATGQLDSANKVFTGIFETAQHQPGLRLPELFCGFEKNYSSRLFRGCAYSDVTSLPSEVSAQKEKPIWYPVSCAPQAWAAATPISMLASSLGLTLDGKSNRLALKESKNKIAMVSLPQFLSKVSIDSMRVGNSTWNINFTRDERNQINAGITQTSKIN